MSLPAILETWSATAAVRGAAVISEDGLLVHDRLEAGADGEAVAALAVTLARDCRQFAEVVGGAGFRRLVVDLDGGPAILAPLDDRHTLVVFAAPGQDLGALLFEIRQSRAALSAAI
jgi:predicted regulator of Ras-like GTPase activity (Roadblock/LC7/MglB family)